MVENWWQVSLLFAKQNRLLLSLPLMWHSDKSSLALKCPNLLVGMSIRSAGCSLPCALLSPRVAGAEAGRASCAVPLANLRPVVPSGSTACSWASTVWAHSTPGVASSSVRGDGLLLCAQGSRQQQLAVGTKPVLPVDSLVGCVMLQTQRVCLLAVLSFYAFPLHANQAVHQ